VHDALDSDQNHIAIVHMAVKIHDSGGRVGNRHKDACCTRSAGLAACREERPYSVTWSEHIEIKRHSFSAERSPGGADADVPIHWSTPES